MKPRNVLWVTLGTFAVVLGVLVGGFVRTGRAQTSEPRTVTCRADFPFMGLVGREQARVHTSWVDGQGDPVVVKTQFLDRKGAVLQESAEQVEPAATVSVRYDPQGRTDQSGRIQFRAVVSLEPATGGPGFPEDTGCPEAITSLERTTPSGAGIAIVAPSFSLAWLQAVRVRPSPSPSPITPPDAGPLPDVGPMPDVGPGADFPAVDFHPPDFSVPDFSNPPPDFSVPDFFNPPDAAPVDFKSADAFSPMDAGVRRR